MSEVKVVRVLHGALDDDAGRTGGMILRGVIEPASLHHLLSDDYQREAQPLSSQQSILAALESGESLPDIELAMRGENFDMKEDVILLQNPVYIVDGLQRVTTALHYITSGGLKSVRLGATIHFNTSKEWERERFRTLNTSRLKVSPNIILRNLREDNPAVLALYGLSVNDKGFVLHGRVSWSQRMTRGELITALTFCKVVGLLHSHKVAAKSVRLEQVVPALNKIVETIGIQAFRENVKTFFDFIDMCWKIRAIQYSGSAVHMKGQYLSVLARLLSDHTDFWNPKDERRLQVAPDLRGKFSKFNTHDPEVVRLAGTSGMARWTLYSMMRDYINSGKRTRRLTSRHPDGMIPMDLEEDDAAAA